MRDTVNVKLMTSAEAARYLRVSRRTLDRLRPFRCSAWSRQVQLGERFGGVLEVVVRLVVVALEREPDVGVAHEQHPQPRRNPRLPERVFAECRRLWKEA